MTVKTFKRIAALMLHRTTLKYLAAQVVNALALLSMAGLLITQGADSGPKIILASLLAGYYFAALTSLLIVLHASAIVKAKKAQEQE